MEIRPYTDRNEERIVNLFQKVFGKEMSLKFWYWRFLSNPFTEDTFISLAWQDNKLIGHYAASPIELLVDGRVVKSAISMTTMIDPDYQKLGLFSQLANTVNQTLQHCDYELIWGFPNNKSHYGLINGIGWRDIATIPFLSLDDHHIVNFEKKATESTEHFNFEAIDTSIFLNEDTTVQIHKTKKYLNWRYIDNPINTYKVFEMEGACIVYKTIVSFSDTSKNEVDIVEISNNIKYKTLKQLISNVIHKEDNVCKINVWINVFSSKYKLFERLGFVPTLPLTHFCYRPLLNNVSDKCSDYRNWDLSLGYSDVY